MQSWHRYQIFDIWRDSFLMPVLSKQFDKLNSGGYMLVNIIDPKIRTKHYPLCDYMVDQLTVNQWVRGSSPRGAATLIAT